MIATLAGAKLGATIAGIAVGLATMLVGSFQAVRSENYKAVLAYSTVASLGILAYVSANTPATPNTSVTAPASSQSASSAAGRQTSDQAKQGKDAKGAPVGPDASGSAAYGLCTAWENVAGNGKAMDSVAFGNLIEAAGGEDKV